MLIAKETARLLGMNTNIKDAKGLPNMDADGKIPKDLGKNFGQMIMEADGFGQVCVCGGGDWGEPARPPACLRYRAWRHSWC